MIIDITPIFWKLINLAEDSLQTETSLVSKKHLNAILHLPAFQKKKEPVGSHAMVNADLCYVR